MWGYQFNKVSTFFNKEATKDIPCILYCGRLGTAVAVALYGEKVRFWPLLTALFDHISHLVIGLG
jgi:hypothetical protein